MAYLGCDGVRWGMTKGRGVQNGVADIVEWWEGEGSGGGSATLLSHVSRGLPGVMGCGGVRR